MIAPGYGTGTITLIETDTFWADEGLGTTGGRMNVYEVYLVGGVVMEIHADGYYEPLPCPDNGRWTFFRDEQTGHNGDTVTVEVATFGADEVKRVARYV